MGSCMNLSISVFLNVILKLFPPGNVKKNEKYVFIVLICLIILIGGF